MWHERLACGDGLSIANTGDRLADLCRADLRHSKASSGKHSLLQGNLTVGMLKTFDKSLRNLKNGSVRVSAVNAQAAPGKASALLLFANGTRLRADQWRLIKKGREPISSFDQLEESTPAANAIGKLNEQLQDYPVKACTSNCL